MIKMHVGKILACRARIVRALRELSATYALGKLDLRRQSETDHRQSL